METAKILLLWLLFSQIIACQNNEIRPSCPTICNPMDLSYRFMPDEPSRREAADPSVIVHKGIFYLFASKSGGYWTSTDLKGWDFIQTDEIPTEEYAPTAISLGDTVFFLASSRTKSTIYKSAQPQSGHWEIAKDSLDFPVWDPAFFRDDDGRLYLYWGCSNRDPIYGIELDLQKNFAPIGEPKALIHANPAQHGWEVPGDYNTLYENAPWIEGAWLNKLNGTYHLQYAGPGTEFKSYADGVYTAKNPLGPYELAPHNPFAYKPEGFAAGAGHGSTFTDNYGNLWHIGTITISQKHMFERRLGLYPAFLDDAGILYTATQYGDYPLCIPDRKIDNFGEIFPGWMLLSYKKTVAVSSSIDSLPAENMVDENIRTFWAAESGNEDEWAAIDLGNNYDVHAVQINFAEYGTQLFGRQPGIRYEYSIESSSDNVEWKILIDRKNSQDDHPHAYIQLPRKETCRYLRIKNERVADGHFALSGFRVFGNGKGNKPAMVQQFSAARDAGNKRTVHLHWNPVKEATGYNIQYGSHENKLYHSYLVYQDTRVTINSLNARQGYFFRIEAFNENGISDKSGIVEVN